MLAACSGEAVYRDTHGGRWRFAVDDLGGKRVRVLSLDFFLFGHHNVLKLGPVLAVQAVAPRAIHVGSEALAVPVTDRR